MNNMNSQSQHLSVVMQMLKYEGGQWRYEGSVQQLQNMSKSCQKCKRGENVTTKADSKQYCTNTN